jgi:hypothetical protein
MALVDLSGSMGGGESPQEPMYGARRLALWLDRVCEMARISYGVYGFDAQTEPICIVELPPDRTAGAAPDQSPGQPQDQALRRRRISGMAGLGGTRLAPALGATVAALARSPAERKLLITVIDGALEDDDADEARTLRATLPQRRIQLLPLYLGADAAVIAANMALFGYVVACPTMDHLTPLARAWLRAAKW